MSFFKISLVCATMLVAVGATLPQPVLAQETGTVPIIKNQSTASITKVKDNLTVPIIATPSTGQVTAPPPGGTPDDNTFSLTITVNAPTTEDTELDLTTSHPDAIGLPSSVIVPAGSDTVTTYITVTPGYAQHHKTVRIHVTANGVTVSAKVKVHYHGEQD